MIYPVDSAIQRLNNQGLEIRIAGSSVPRKEWSQNIKCIINVLGSNEILPTLHFSLIVA